MRTWLAEIRRTWRASLRSPGFLLLASGVLALGIGAGMAVFSLLRVTLLQPVPVPHASRLVVLGPLRRGEIGVGGTTPKRYQRLQSLKGVKSIGLMEKGSDATNIAGGGKPELVKVSHVDRHLMPTLGLHMQLGRNFDAAEDRPDGPRVVVLSHGFWLRRYGGRSDVIGHSMRIEGVAHTIIGVLPASFSAVVNDGDIVLPTALPVTSDNDAMNYVAVARLNDHASIDSVAAQVEARLHALYVANGDPHWSHERFGAKDFSTWKKSTFRPELMLFMDGALLVLLIALVNLANLMLLRAMSRRHEAAVRNALGASWLRSAMPALAEAVFVGFLGTLAGWGLARISLAVLQGVVPAGWLGGVNPQIGAGTIALAFVVGVTAAMLAAGLGMWRSRRLDVMGMLREGGRNGVGVREGRLGRVLVVAQVTLATALLCATGVIVRTLYSASRVSPGFSTHGILTVEMSPVKADAPDAAAVQDLSVRLVQRFEAIPGVQQASVMTNLPGGRWSGGFWIGDIHLPGGTEFGAQFHGVGAGYFRLFDIPVRQGRAFTSDDVRGSENVAIVNQALAAHRYDGHALGKLIQRGSGKHKWSARIVGVVANTRQLGPLEAPPEMAYEPLAQMSDDTMRIFRRFQPICFALRVRGNPYSYRGALKRAVGEMVPDQPIANIRSMSRVMASTVAPMRINLLFMGIFSIFSLLLASAGIYAVMAVAVATREHELSVRMALGASPRKLIRMVLRGGLLQIVSGLFLGLLLAASLGDVMRAVMWQIGRQGVVQPATAIAVCVVLATAGLLACLVPALRAAHMPPMRALQGD